VCAPRAPRARRKRERSGERVGSARVTRPCPMAACVRWRNAFSRGTPRRSMNIIRGCASTHAANLLRTPCRHFLSDTTNAILAPMAAKRIHLPSAKSAAAGFLRKCQGCHSGILWSSGVSGTRCSVFSGANTVPWNAKALRRGEPAQGFGCLSQGPSELYVIVVGKLKIPAESQDLFVSLRLRPDAACTAKEKNRVRRNRHTHRP
jgi:hypothetical protein